MADKPYSKREQDLIFKGIQSELCALNTNMKNGFEGVHTRLDTTNGKVKKIILALVLAFGIIIGLGFTELAPVLSLIL